MFMEELYESQERVKRKKIKKKKDGFAKDYVAISIQKDEKSRCYSCSWIRMKTKLPQNTGQIVKHFYFYTHHRTKEILCMKDPPPGLPDSVSLPDLWDLRPGRGSKPTNSWDGLVKDSNISESTNT